MRVSACTSKLVWFAHGDWKGNGTSGLSDLTFGQARHSGPTNIGRANEPYLLSVTPQSGMVSCGQPVLWHLRLSKVSLKPTMTGSITAKSQVN